MYYILVKGPQHPVNVYFSWQYVTKWHGDFNPLWNCLCRQLWVYNLCRAITIFVYIYNIQFIDLQVGSPNSAGTFVFMNRNRKIDPPTQKKNGFFSVTCKSNACFQNYRSSGLYAKLFPKLSMGRVTLIRRLPSNLYLTVIIIWKLLKELIMQQMEPCLTKSRTVRLAISTQYLTHKAIVDQISRGARL